MGLKPWNKNFKKLLGVNYVPVKGINYLPSISLQEFRKDIAKAKSLNVNALRIPLVGVVKADGSLDLELLEHYNKLVCVAKQEGFFVEVIAFAIALSGKNFYLKNTNFFTDKENIECQRKLLRMLDENACIDMIDLFNEPDWYRFPLFPSYNHVSRMQAKAWVKTLKSCVKNKPVTIGLASNYIFPHAFIPWELDIDVISYHYYWIYRSYYPLRNFSSLGMSRPDLDLAEAEFLLSMPRQGRKVYLQELGVSDWKVFKRSSSVKNFQHVLLGLLPFYADKDFLGVSFWTLNDVTAREHPYNKYGFERKFGLYQGSKPKPIARVVKKFSKMLSIVERFKRPKPDVAMLLPRVVDVDRGRFKDALYMARPYIEVYHYLRRIGLPSIDLITSVNQARNYKVVIAPKLNDLSIVESLANNVRVVASLDWKVWLRKLLSKPKLKNLELVPPLEQIAWLLSSENAFKVLKPYSIVKQFLSLEFEKDCSQAYVSWLESKQKPKREWLLIVSNLSFKPVTTIIKRSSKHKTVNLKPRDTKIIKWKA